MSAHLADRASAHRAQTVSDLPQLARTTVAVLPVANERLRGLLAAYLKGPGQRHFELASADAAHVLIADADSDAARAELRRRLAHQPQSAVAIGRKDPALTGAVWLPRPFGFEDLLRAVAAARAALPRACDAAGAHLMPEAPIAVAAPALPRPAPVIAAAASRAPFGRRAEGDWTGTSVWLMLGLLAVVGLASVLGWRPAAEPPATRALGASPGAESSPEAALRRAVADSLRDYRGHSPEEIVAIRQQLRWLEIEQQQVDDAADRQQALEAMMRPGAPAAALRFDPQRMPVALMAPARPSPARDEALRRSLNDAVSRSLAAVPATQRR